jgi:hypothetical protein
MLGMLCPNVPQVEHGQMLQVAVQHVLGLVERSESYATQLCQSTIQPSSPPAAGRKRRRAESPGGLSGGQRQVEEQLQMPGTPTSELLPMLRTELRHHQLQGVRWLASLYTQASLVEC